MPSVVCRGVGARGNIQEPGEIQWSISASYLEAASVRELLPTYPSGLHPVIKTCGDIYLIGSHACKDLSLGVVSPSVHFFLVSQLDGKELLSPFSAHPSTKDRVHSRSHPPGAGG